MMELKVIRLFAFVVLATACNGEPRAQNREDAIRIAAMHKKGVPWGQEGPPMKVSAQENARYWLVRYVPAEGIAGGDNAILIDKKSGEVVLSYGSQ